MKSPEEALAIFLKRLSKKSFPGSETVPVTQARGRITARPVHARLSSPHFHTAAMDGFAIHAENTFGAGPQSPIAFTIDYDAWPVNTGRPLPPDTNAVIMIENVHFLDDETFDIDQALVPWQNVRRVGEDFVASEMILPSHHMISAYEVGAILAGGFAAIEVVEKPRVLLIPTGSELVSSETVGDKEPAPGEVIEFNSAILAGLVEQAGGIALIHPIVPDDFAAIRKAILDGVCSDAHVVVINAGSSAGTEDYTAAAIRELGELLVHGVAMMPGKPTILGIVEDKPVMGNPGYPVSAVFSFETFGLALLEALQGAPHSHRTSIEAITARKIPSKLGREEFLRVKLGKVGDRVIASPLPRGAGSITSLTKADGIIRIPAVSEGIDRAEPVQVELIRPAARIDRTVVIIGSHDLTLDLLGDELIPHEVFVSSNHVGSLGGLIALKSRYAHIAPSHLLDMQTGEYNWSYIREYLPEIPVRLFHCVMREQGFIVHKGNPKSIKTFEDLIRDDVTFINRQAGAGTRVLLDYHLDREKLDSERINGYEIEEYTHTAVAVAVLSEVADVGMGVFAAARALGLDFIPVATEQYDLVIPEQFMSDDRIQIVLETMRGDSFKRRVLALGGYNVDRTAEEVKPKDPA
jgi:putative molybdopterin biosynthesis protein